MTKMTYKTLACDLSVSENYSVFSQVACEYDNDTILYAVKKFFLRSSKICKECTFESWQMRIGKIKSKRIRFEYMIPASLMELPGNWVYVSGFITNNGVNIAKVKITDHYPRAIAA